VLGDKPTWRDVSINYKKLEASLWQCNADKALIGQWFKSLSKGD
jgi:hypothetical protein